jgi:hypothetical protein
MGSCVHTPLFQVLNDAASRGLDASGAYLLPRTPGRV